MFEDSRKEIEAKNARLNEAFEKINARLNADAAAKLAIDIEKAQEEAKARVIAQDYAQHPREDNEPRTRKAWREYLKQIRKE